MRRVLLAALLWVGTALFSQANAATITLSPVNGGVQTQISWEGSWNSSSNTNGPVLGLSLPFEFVPSGFELRSPSSDLVMTRDGTPVEIFALQFGSRHFIVNSGTNRFEPGALVELSGSTVLSLAFDAFVSFGSFNNISGGNQITLLAGSPVTIGSPTPAPVPLPAAAWFFLTALFGAGWFRRRQVKASA